MKLKEILTQVGVSLFVYNHRDELYVDEFIKQFIPNVFTIKDVTLGDIVEIVKNEKDKVIYLEDALSMIPTSREENRRVFLESIYEHLVNNNLSLIIKSQSYTTVSSQQIPAPNRAIYISNFVGEISDKKLKVIKNRWQTNTEEYNIEDLLIKVMRRKKIEKINSKINL